MKSGQKFLFVNKDARSLSLSHSQGEERQRIFSRAQSNLCHGPNNFVVATVADFAANQPDCGKQSNNTVRCRNRVPPVRDIAQADFDPFQSMVVYLDKEMQGMLAFYHYTVLTSIWFEGMITIARRQLMEYAAENAALLYTILGLTNAVMLARSKADDRAYYVAYFKGKALQHLRERLFSTSISNVSPATAYTIALLLRLECGQGDLAAARVHHCGLTKIMDAITPHHDIPFTILLSIQSSLDYSSVALQREPYAVAPLHLKELDCTKIPISKTSIAKDDMPATAEESCYHPFSLPPYRKFVGHKLVDIICNLQALKLNAKRTKAQGPALPPHEIQSLHKAVFALEHRLLLMGFQQSPCEPHHLAREVIRLGLLIVSGPPVNISLPRAPFKTSLAKQLRWALERSLQSGAWRLCPDLLVWALIVAACVSCETDNWPWVFSTTLSVCRELQIDDISFSQEISCKLGLVPVNFEHIMNLMQEWIRSSLH